MTHHPDKGKRNIVTAWFKKGNTWSKNVPEYSAIKAFCLLPGKAGVAFPPDSPIYRPGVHPRAVFSSREEGRCRSTSQTE